MARRPHRRAAGAGAGRVQPVQLAGLGPVYDGEAGQLGRNREVLTVFAAIGLVLILLCLLSGLHD